MSYATGLVVGKFWPPHRGHQLLLETAAAEVAELLVLVYAHPDDRAHPAPERAAWLRELYRGDDVARGPHIGTTPLRLIALTAEADGLPPDAADDHTHREFVRQWLARHGYVIEVVFSSEAYGPGFAAHLGAAHVLVDAARRQVPISGTQLRAALAAGDTAQSLPAAAFLHPFVAAQYGAVAPAAVPRLVLLGAESSGKTTLATALAEALGTAWVPEYGRLLHEQKNGELAYEDLLYIGRRQLELEDEAAPQARPGAGSSAILMRPPRRCIPTTIFTAATRPCRPWPACAGSAMPARLYACPPYPSSRMAGAAPRRCGSFSTALF